MSGRMRLAIAQPTFVEDTDTPANADIAVELIARASVGGAGLILFPEGSPGPFRPDRIASAYDVAPRLREAARANGIAVCWSRVEICPDGLPRMVAHVFDREGRDVLRYEKTHTSTIPPAESGGWVAPGDGLGLVELDGVRIGVIICYELWFPEMARRLAIQGAEVILSPSGGRFSTLTSNWQALARARAIENLCYVALTSNIFGDEVGPAMIAGPEEVVIASGSEDLLVASLNLERVRWLRGRYESLKEPKPFRSIPGLLRARRPEIYRELVEPREGLFDYHDPASAE